MNRSHLSAVLGPVALVAAALGAAAGHLAGPAEPQTTIEGRKRPATVYIRPDVLGVQSANGLPFLGTDKERSVSGELIAITSDAIELEINSDRLWIPRENVAAVFYDV